MAMNSRRHTEEVLVAKTNLAITRLGLGTAPIGGLFTPVSIEDAKMVMDYAMASGIKYFDTAPVYGNGLAEKRIGPLLGPVTAQLVALSTKVGRLLVTPPSTSVGLKEYEVLIDYSPDGIRQSLEASLSRLQLNSVNILYIHDADDYADQAIAQAYPELEKMRSEGLISAIGVGMNQVEIPTRFVNETDINIVLCAGRYSLLDQSAAKELLPAAINRNVSIVIGGVYNSGILATPSFDSTYDYVKAPANLVKQALAIRDLLQNWKVPLTAAAIQFPLRHAAVTSVLTGARSVKELSENIDAFNFEIPEECWTALEENDFCRIAI
jgi:D-threo-aldose 1-dehydrogenase